VTTGGETAVGARAGVADRARGVRAALADGGHDRVRTAGLSVERTKELSDPSTDRPFCATESLRVACTPETAATVVVAATGAGGTVPRFEHTLGDGRLRDLQDEALAAGWSASSTTSTRRLTTRPRSGVGLG